MKKLTARLAFAAAFTVVLSATVFAVNSLARTIKGTTTAYTTTTTEITTEVTTEITTETTTLKSISASARGVKNKNKTTTTTVTTTEETTETTTEFDKTIYEGNAEITTIEAVTYAENPVDKYGNPLTGNALEAYNVVKNTFKDKWKAITEPEIKEEVIYNDADRTVKEKTFTFINNDVFSIKRYNFNTIKDDRYSETITIPGTNFEMRYISPETGDWYMSQNPENVAKQTLFIDTDQS